MAFRILLLLCLSQSVLSAQEQPVLKLSQWQRLEELNPYVTMYVDSSLNKSIESIVPLAFFTPPTNYLSQRFSYPIHKFPHFFKVRVENDLNDTARFFFMVSPQNEAEVVTVSKMRKIERVAASWYQQPNVNRAKIYRFALQAGEQNDYIIKIVFPQHSSSSVALFMEPEANLNYFFVFWKGANNNSATFMWFFCGMLLMMFLYIVLKFIQIRSREYFYYGAYIFFFFLFFFMRTMGTSGNETILYGGFFSGIANDQLQACAYIMYYFFVKHFLSTKTSLPQLHRMLNFATAFLLAYMIIDFILYWFPDLIYLKYRVWDGVRTGLLVITGYSIFQIVKLKSPLGSYIIWGGLLLSSFALAAMLFSFSPDPIANFPYPFDEPLTYFQLGIAAELICFSLGLGYKSRLAEVEKMQAEQNLKMQGDRQEFERYRAMTDAREGERTRIATDLHDGVGGLLAGVRISLANIKNRLSFTQDDELIFARSIDMLDGSMSELRRVAHALKPPSLKVFGLKVALRDYVESINTMKTMKTIFQAIGEEYKFDSEQELIIYRVIQELISNTIKHAQASECLVQISYLSDHLSITIEDNGKGFNMDRKSNGTGLNNIRQRVDFLKGTLDFHSSEGSGTSVQIGIPFS
jgi:signal transduction histidine kinase